jgi:hypothetical protein
MNIEEKNFYLYGDNDTPVVTIDTDDYKKSFACYAFINNYFILRMPILPYLITDSIEITEEEFIEKTDIEKYAELLKEYS